MKKMIIVKMTVLLIKEKNLQEVAVSILLHREFELHHLPLQHHCCIPSATTGSLYNNNKNMYKYNTTTTLIKVSHLKKKK